MQSRQVGIGLINAIFLTLGVSFLLVGVLNIVAKNSGYYSSEVFVRNITGNTGLNDLGRSARYYGINLAAEHLPNRCGLLAAAGFQVARRQSANFLNYALEGDACFRELLSGEYCSQELERAYAQTLKVSYAIQNDHSSSNIDSRILTDCNQGWVDQTRWKYRDVN